VPFQKLGKYQRDTSLNPSVAARPMDAPYATKSTDLMMRQLI